MGTRIFKYFEIRFLNKESFREQHYHSKKSLHSLLFIEMQKVKHKKHLCPPLWSLHFRQVRAGNKIHPESQRDQSSSDAHSTVMGLWGFNCKASIQQWKDSHFLCLCIEIWVQTRRDTYDIAGLAVGLLLHCVERLSPQLVVALNAGEALHVEDLVHGRAAGAFPNNVLPAARTATCHQTERTPTKVSSCSQLQKRCSHTPVLESKWDTMAQPAEEQVVSLLSQTQRQWKAVWWWPAWKDPESLETDS